MKAIFDYALARLSENSTWRGIILICVSLGICQNLSPEMQEKLVAAGLGAVGLINVLRKQ